MVINEIPIQNLVTLNGKFADAKAVLKYTEKIPMFIGDTPVVISVASFVRPFKKKHHI